MFLPLWIEKNKLRARELAAHVGWPTSMVSKVKLGRKQVPADKCPAIEEFTGGAVTCEEMRPDVKWHVLRNSARPIGGAEPFAEVQMIAAPDAVNDSADVQPGRA